MGKTDNGLGEQVTVRGPNSVGDTQTSRASDMGLESKPPTMFGKGGQGTRAVRLLGSRTSWTARTGSTDVRQSSARSRHLRRSE